MVMQAAVDFWVGGSNPGVANAAAAQSPASTDLKYCSRVHYHSTDSCVTVLCLPTACSLLSENF